jgi:cell shape-determining protein MreC|tara:strand:- start:6 stop:227 length:222 start_codon:yes stop_codon:yes gene_type:complete
MDNERTIDDINLGDIFLVRGGANQHGAGHQIAIVNKITTHDNIYCEKLSIKRKKSIGKKCRLDLDDIIMRLKS